MDTCFKLVLALIVDVAVRLCKLVVQAHAAAGEAMRASGATVCLFAMVAILPGGLLLSPLLLKRLRHESRQRR